MSAGGGQGGACRRRLQLMLAVAGLLFFAAVARADSLTIATYNVENYVAADRLVDGV